MCNPATLTNSHNLLVHKCLSCDVDIDYYTYKTKKECNNCYNNTNETHKCLSCDVKIDYYQYKTYKKCEKCINRYMETNCHCILCIKCDRAINCFYCCKTSVDDEFIYKEYDNQLCHACYNITKNYINSLNRFYNDSKNNDGELQCFESFNLNKTYISDLNDEYNSNSKNQTDDDSYNGDDESDESYEIDDNIVNNNYVNNDDNEYYEDEDADEYNEDSDYDFCYDRDRHYGFISSSDSDEIEPWFK